jgi:hypothetical protein
MLKALPDWRWHCVQQHTKAVTGLPVTEKRIAPH